MTCRPRPPVPPVGSRGHTLPEVMVVVALIATFGAGALPAIDRGLKRGRLRAAARDLAMAVRHARTAAIVRQTNVALVFDPAGGNTYSLHLDGNRNGVRRADIRRGIDPRLSGPWSIPERFRGVDVRILATPAIPRIPPDPGLLGNLDDPVQFGPADMISCSSNGSCSAGTVYLSVGQQRMAGVRVFGSTGRVRLWEYEPLGRRWDKRSGV